MTNQIQLNDEDEIAAAAELETVKVISAAIAEQNTVNQNQAAAILESVKTFAEQLEALNGAFKQLIEGLNITVNVPDQPAPVINIPAPVVNIAPADVVVKVPPEKKKEGEITFRRDGDGRIASPIKFTTK